MLDIHGPAIDAFVATTVQTFSSTFPEVSSVEQTLLESAAREALEALLGCDCSYHDLHHTMLVTDCGQAILLGRQLGAADLTAGDWLHAMIALLYHDIGYIRGLLHDDREGSYVVDEAGNRAVPGPGATDAFLTPHHVTRGCLYIQQRYGSNALLDADLIASHIEMTRFPVPIEAYYQETDTISALVRAADLIGQMGDPQYLHKLSRLYAEFVETGDASRLGYNNAGDLRANYPEFFQDRVYPHITEALNHLSRTRGGRQWIAGLYAHVFSEQQSMGHAGPERAPLDYSRLQEQQADPLAERNPAPASGSVTRLTRR